MIRADIGLCRNDLIYYKIELMIGIREQLRHTQQFLGIRFCPGILAGCLRRKGINRECPSILSGDVIPDRLREVVGFVQLQVGGIIFRTLVVAKVNRGRRHDIGACIGTLRHAVYIDKAAKIGI